MILHRYHSRMRTARRAHPAIDAPSAHASADPRWLVLFHQLPQKPDYLRVRIGRLLRHLGAVAIKNSVYVVPTGVRQRVTLSALVREIHENGGEAAVCEARFVDGLSD